MPQAGDRATGAELGLPPGQYVFLVCPDCSKERWAKPGGAIQKHPDGMAPCNSCRLAREKAAFSALLKGGRR